jgi:hypothetical protein
VHLRNSVPCVLLIAAGLINRPATAGESGVGRVRYEFDLAPSKTLSLNIRSGDVVIEGADAPKLAISFDGENSGKATDVKVRFKDKGDTVECGITGGPHSDFRILIAVPRKLHLFVRMPFGAMQIADVEGSKDVSLRAGDLDIGIGAADDYAHIDASVGTGEIDLSALNVETGGFFRKFHKDGPGQYTLRVHIGAGQVTLH